MKLSDRKHLGLLAGLGCIACYKQGTPGTPAEIHHIRTGQGMSQRSGHRQAIPLCPPHHRGTAGLKVPSVHGSPRAFAQTFGTELQLLDLVNELLGNGNE